MLCAFRAVQNVPSLYLILHAAGQSLIPQVEESDSSPGIMVSPDLGLGVTLGFTESPEEFVAGFCATTSPLAWPPSLPSTSSCS